MNIIRNDKVKMYNILSRLPLGNIQAKGWIKDQLLRSKEGMGGHLDELEPDMIANPFVDYSSFKFFNGKPADPTFAAGWSSEISGTYWTGLVELAFTLNDSELIKKAEIWVNKVLKHQEEDGYLGGYSKDTDRNADYNAWGANWCYRALLSYYDATRRQDVLDAVYKGLLWFCENWKNHKTRYVGSTLIESMICVYSLTGDKRLLDFSNDWLDWLETKPEDSPNIPLKEMEQQNRISQYLSNKLPFNSMHTVAYGEDVKHPALVFCANGNSKYLQASINGLKKALDKVVSPTGGPGSNSEYLSPVSAVTETEYCNFTTWNHTYAWMEMVTANSIYGDYIERAALNGAQGARKKDERAIAYMTTPNEVRATKKSTLYGQNDCDAVYAPNFHVCCCPAQSVRLMPEYIRSMCFTDNEDSLYLLCYGPAKINSKKLSFEMDTMYPFRENINLIITQANENSKLYFRIPNWCKEYQVRINGIPTEVQTNTNGFAEFTEPLHTGDLIEIRFKMTVSMNRLDDSNMNSKHPYVFQRGPLVFSIPIPTIWTSFPGIPITPLPQNWAWFEATQDYTNVKRYYEPWGMAVPPDIDIDKIKVIENDVDDYVWDTPPVELSVPLKTAPYSFRSAMKGTVEPYGTELETEGDIKYTRMIPHGCTNLRITFIPAGK